MKLSPRKERILACVVEHYIPSGEPVGSKALCDELGYSSATIRNEMSELCELGFLEKKHSSSGRVPSSAGYRYYIDNLMKTGPLSDSDRNELEQTLRSGADSPDKLLEKAGGLLARLTGCAAVLTTPVDESAEISKVELIPASGKTAILVLLTSSGIIKNCVCKIDINIDEDIEESFKNVVDQYFIKTKVAELSEDMLKDIISALPDEKYAIKPLLSALYRLGKDAGESKTFVEGETNLLTHRDSYGNMEELLAFLQQKDQLSRLVTYDRSRANDKLSILIGSENYFSQMESSSVIMSQYSFGANAVGTIGIIGPTRIDYSKLIPDVEYLTGMVSKLLSENFDEEE